MNQPLARQREKLSEDIQALRQQLEKSWVQKNECASYQIETDLVGLQKELNSLQITNKLPKDENK